MNILLSRKDRLLIGIAVVLYLVAIFVRLSLIGHLIVFAFFLKLLQKIFKDKQTPTYRIIMLIVILSIFILIRIYNIYQIVSGWNNDIGRSSQIIKPSISLPPKKEFLDLKVELPPVGIYCNGCDSRIPKGLFTKSPTTGELIVARGRSISGGYDTPTGGWKWNYTFYAFRGLLSELPKDSELIMPGGSFLQDAIKMEIKGSREFRKPDPFYEGEIRPFTYIKLSEKINSDDITIHSFNVYPTFNDVPRKIRHAILTKNGLFAYIMFEWQTKDFDETFDKIIDSIRFE